MKPVGRPGSPRERAAGSNEPGSGVSGSEMNCVWGLFILFWMIGGFWGCEGGFSGWYMGTLVVSVVFWYFCCG